MDPHHRTTKSSTGPAPGAPAPNDPAAGAREARGRRLGLLLGVTLAAVMVGWLIKQQVPSTVLAQWHFSQAQAKFKEDDLEGALAACDRALALLPEEPTIYLLRAEIHQERADWAAALDDLNKVLDLNAHFPEGYRQRSFVHLQLGKYDEAVADARKTLEWWGNDDPRALNHAAYTTAVANRELEKALTEIERALKLYAPTREKVQNEKTKTDDAAALAAESALWRVDVSWASYLDTRGFVRFRLGQQAQSKNPQEAKAHYEAALADFDEAIRLVSQVRKAAAEKATEGETAYDKQRERSLTGSLAIMHQHRYQAYEALGEKEKARIDQEFAARLGYSPEKHGL